MLGLRKEVKPMDIQEGFSLIIRGLEMIRESVQCPGHQAEKKDNGHEMNDEKRIQIKKEEPQGSWPEKMNNLLQLTKRKKDEGFADEIRMVLRKHNIKCISEVTAEQYQDVYDDICGL